MDETKNDENSEDQEVYEVIKDVTIKKNVYDQLSGIATMTGLGPLVNLLSSAASTLFTQEEQERMWENFKEANEKEQARLAEHRKLREELEEVMRKSLREEARTWASIRPVASHTSVLFFIYNSTNETFKIDYSSWDSNRQSAKEYEIGPLQYLSFTLRSAIPQRHPDRKVRVSSKVNHGFTYRSAKFAFDFSTQLYIRHHYINGPSVIREHSLRSVGRYRLNCEYELKRSMAGSPYSYSMAIYIDNPNPG
jgi:hypothetical protein